MLRVITILILLLLPRSVWSQTLVERNEYSVIDDHPLRSSVASAFISTPNGARWTQIKMRTQNRRINGYSSYAKIRYHKSFCRKDSKELVYLIPGVGGRAKDPKANYLAYKLNKNCFDVVILPSAFTSEFLVALSSTGIAGNIERDAIDYIKFIKYIEKYLLRTRSISYEKRHLFGYSLGAFYSAHISKISQEQEYLKFYKTILVNPPGNILHGINKVDEYCRSGDRVSWTRKLKGIWTFGKNLYASLRFTEDEKRYPLFVNRIRWLRDDELKYFIGKMLSKSLKDVIITSQYVLAHDHGKHLGIINVVDKFSNYYRYASQENNRVLNKLEMIDYFKVVLGRYLYHFENVEMSEQSLSQKYELASLKNFLKQNKSLYIIHNADDFLLHERDITAFIDSLDRRFILYPTGGHMGNYWYQQNLDKYIELLKL